MKTELFDIFSEKQLLAIKDAIAYGLWGNIEYQFRGHTEAVDTLAYCTGYIHKGGHFTSKEVSGICSGISKVVNDNKLDFISYDTSFWGDDAGGIICFNMEKIEATLEELEAWAKKQ